MLALHCCSKVRSILFLNLAFQENMGDPVCIRLSPDLWTYNSIMVYFVSRMVHFVSSC